MSLFKDYQSDYLNKYFYPDENSQGKASIDDKIKEIEERIKLLYEKRIPHFIADKESSVQMSEILKKKLENVTNDIKQFSNDVKSNINEKFTQDVIDTKEDLSPKETIEGTQKTYESPIIENTLNNIGKRLDNLDQLASEINSTDKKPILDTQEIEKSVEKEDALHQKLFDSFYGEPKVSDQKEKESVFKDKLEQIDDQIKEIKDSLSTFYKSQPSAVTGSVAERLKLIEDKLAEEKIKVTEEKKYEMQHGPMIIRPKSKKEGLFNDVNLTEDYELGFRFYQLGFKTGFFNVKIDKEDESSRIATAEFFPNKFWASVKQRSRWVAGIVFQNWKAHKWAGNLATKYFLFRDRKSIFSFFSAFLSNILLIYLIVSVLGKMLGYYNVYSLVGHSSVLWYLVIGNLIFMISRLSHRFIFTYNWYGLKYAFFSLFRLPMDTIINFFAIVRSINVYKKTREKVVWDSTQHY